MGEGKTGDVELFDTGLLGRVELGKSLPEYGHASYRYIIEALKLVFSGEAHAIVTSPINKASIHAAGIKFTGHTELLAHYGGVVDYVMMLANPSMRVSLVTIHIPLKAVPQAISADRVLKCILVTERSLKTLFHISRPFIRVAGLNPHAGESGVIGDEEACIDEAVGKARSLGLNVAGPFPGDTLFHRTDCDGFIAMYHDQGLIPVKATGFDRTVNLTLGLPFVRTSPGHGTGYDIAGQGIANPSSFIEAYRLAEKLSGAR